MATQPDTPPAVSNWPDSPSRARPLDFPEEADSFLGHFPTGQTDQQNVVDWTNQTAQQVYDNALESAASASDSESSAQNSADSATISQNAGNILGEWSGLTGSVSLGEIVLHVDGRWQATTAIADITASEPSLSNADWVLINYNGKSLPIADGVTLSAIAINEISATQSNQLPLAASVPVNTMLKITVSETYKGIKTTHLASGSDTTTDSNGTLPNVDDPVAGFIFNWPSGGTLFVTSNGVDNWRY